MKYNTVIRGNSRKEKKSDQIKSQSALLDRFDGDGEEEEGRREKNRRGGATGDIIWTVEREQQRAATESGLGITLMLQIDPPPSLPKGRIGNNGEPGTGPKRRSFFFSAADLRAGH